VQDFLKSELLANTPSSWTGAGVRIGLAVALGMAVAGIYKATRPKAYVTPSFPVTLVLLSGLIAMVAQVVGTNTALAFSLVGALSIVRFRTVVRDTEDTGFVIFAVVVGMSVGARNIVVALTGLVLLGLTVFLMKPRRAAAAIDEAHYQVTVRVGLGHDVEPLLAPALDEFLVRRQLVSIGTVKQGMSFEVAYSGSLVTGQKPESLVKALNRLDGVQSVDLVRQTPAPGQDTWW
jgi:multisubunit Na+/H+ antiporter MnhG subunit